MDLCFYLHRSGPKWRSLVPLAGHFFLSFSRSVGSWKESKHEADNNPPLPWDYTLSIQFMELPFTDSDPVSAFCSSGFRSCLVLPVLAVSLNLAHCFLDYRIWAHNTFCWRPFPSGTHSEQKLCTSYTTLPFVIHGPQA